MPSNNSLRVAEPGDEELILSWANDPNVRNSSFNASVISPDQHRTWFEAKLVSSSVLMFVLESDGRSAGLIRFEKDKDHIQLSYLIAPHARGKRLASEMIELGMKEKRKNWGEIPVVATIIRGNIRSRKSLISAGFSPLGGSRNEEIFVKT